MKIYWSDYYDNYFFVKSCSVSFYSKFYDLWIENVIDVPEECIFELEVDGL